MESIKAKAAIKDILQIFQKEEINWTDITASILKLRDQSIETKDPLITKILRLTAEHIEENKNFAIELPEDSGDEEMPSFEYLMMLIDESKNKYNREEIRYYVEEIKKFEA